MIQFQAYTMIKDEGNKNLLFLSFLDNIVFIFNRKFTSAIIPLCRCRCCKIHRYVASLPYKRWASAPSPLKIIFKQALLINDTGNSNSPISETCGASNSRCKKHKKSCLNHNRKSKLEQSSKSYQEVQLINNA